MPETAEAKSSFDQFAILELMGKVRLGGRVREEQVFGVPMIRIDIPKDVEWKEFNTRYFHLNALYGITPVSQAVAFGVARYNDTPPARSWEMPKALPEADAESEAHIPDESDGYTDHDDF
ncbi:MAG: hypothetical protein QOH63_1949 [Acidobacteriota bacterium]|nr:hypothetical protein [Acidobacteriota bacterium]